MKNPVEQYGEHRILESIDRLEYRIKILDDVNMKADYALAVECLEYLLDQAKKAEADAIAELERATKPHWIVEDHGFAGTFYKCSKCGESYWGYADTFDDEICANCHTVMDPAENDYMD